MNIFTIEKSRQQLLKDINSGLSGRQKLFRLIEYVEKVTEQLSGESAVPFILEFIPYYTKALNEFRSFGLHPDSIKKVIDSTNKILQLSFIDEYQQSIKSGLQRIEKEYTILMNSIKGESAAENLYPKIIFPVLEKLQVKEAISFSGCFLETVTITILSQKLTSLRLEKTQNENKFTVTPGERKTDEQLLEQIKTSWQLAVEYSKRFVRKIHPYHNVVVKFDSEAGTYTGSSLGIALTIGFIQEILLFYNAPCLTNIKRGIALTGSVDTNGKINSVSRETIEKKLEGVFYSNLDTFVVPEADRPYALEKLNELQKEFPNRNLKIIGAEQLSDVLNRRDLIDIRRQPVIVRSGKFVKKNWVSLTVILILFAVTSFFLLREIDNNPVIIDANQNELLFKNKSGKILWTANIAFRFAGNEKNKIKFFTRIVDVNDDGVNEIVITHEAYDVLDHFGDTRRVACYSNEGEIIWEYIFSDTVSADIEKQLPFYWVFLIDTMSFESKKELWLYANNVESFSSAVFNLDLRTGERLDKIFWSSGHITEAMLKDLNGDYVKDIIVTGVDNGLKKAVVFALDYFKINGCRPTIPEYKIHNFNYVDMLCYVQFPRTDHSIMFDIKSNGFVQGHLVDRVEEKRFAFESYEGGDGRSSDLIYTLDYNLKDIDIVVASPFSVKRDSLVARGILKPPFTDTSEYKKLLKSQILYWRGKDWVKREEMQ